MAAEGGGCRDNRRGSSASEVGTDDGTAKTNKIITRWEKIALIMRLVWEGCSDVLNIIFSN